MKNKNEIIDEFADRLKEEFRGCNSRTWQFIADRIEKIKKELENETKNKR